MNPEIFDSSVRPAGDLAGVFEYDGATAYFYLYDQTRTEGHMVVDAIQVTNGKPDFAKEDVSIQWDPSETKVGLLIRGQLWAAFDDAGLKYGGHYCPSTQPDIPTKITSAFLPVSKSD